MDPVLNHRSVALRFSQIPRNVVLGLASAICSGCLVRAENRNCVSPAAVVGLNKG